LNIKGVVAQDFTPGYISEIYINALDITAFELIFDGIRCVFDGGFFIDDLVYSLASGCCISSPGRWTITLRSWPTSE
jgi:hypothetical protein